MAIRASFWFLIELYIFYPFTFLLFVPWYLNCVSADRSPALSFMSNLMICFWVSVFRPLTLKIIISLNLNLSFSHLLHTLFGPLFFFFCLVWNNMLHNASIFISFSGLSSITFLLVLWLISGLSPTFLTFQVYLHVIFYHFTYCIKALKLYCPISLLKTMKSL